MRPTYETHEDREAERRAKKYIELAWSCYAYKIPIKYGVDFALLRGNTLHAFAEYKYRKGYTIDDIDRMGGYMLSLDKVMAAHNLKRYTMKDTFLIVTFKDGKMFQVNITEKSYPVSVGGRKDRNDWQDMEPVVMIPTSDFTKMPT